MSGVKPWLLGAVLLLPLGLVSVVVANEQTDGQLDPSFGVAGVVLTDFGGFNDVDLGLGDLVIQEDGKIVVAGIASFDFGLVRYLRSGDLDEAFGNGGLVTTDFGGTDEAHGLAIQADGKLVAAGLAAAGELGVTRYTPDGALDETFGDGGKVSTSFGPPLQALAAAVQADGKIVVAGQSSPEPSTRDFALVRYNTDGSLDTGFGVGGLVITDAGGEEAAWAVALQPDGKIVAVGGSRDFVATRYLADGTLDPTFGIDGVVTTSFRADVDWVDQARALHLQPDGTILVAGEANAIGRVADFGLARYHGDGSLDTAFGSGGLVTLDFDGGFDEVRDIAVQADGKVVAAGLVQVDTTPSVTDFGLARFAPDGALDASFGSGGKVVTDFGGTEAEAWAVAIQADGNIVASGYANGGGTFDYALARYLVLSTTDADGDGVPDTDDLCPDTDLACDTAPDRHQKKRLWSDADGNFVFGDRTRSGLTVSGTAGCSASQIIEAAGLGVGHGRFGISQSAMHAYLATLNGG